ncbi:MAG: ROK family protein [Gemmatimonadetes bacterium]|nr:ROK family protein [Gemmatimonadota bacterium]
MRVIVGVDVGGTNIVIGTVTEDGKQVSGIQRLRTPTGHGADPVITSIAGAVNESIGQARTVWGEDLEVVGVGIGSPGPIDTKRGLVVTSPNLGWTNVPLRDRVSELVRLPTTLDNDANCAVLGEWWRGAARGAKVVVGVTVGTGVGGGLVLDGKIFHGASDVAGEFGHMTIDSTGRRCACGNYGCLEAYASGPAIAKRATESIEAGATSTLTQYVDENSSRITAALVYQAANDGDELALEVVRDTARFLGAGIANLVNICNPEIVVLCGGVTSAGEKLFRPLREEVNRRAFRQAAEACRIVAGELPGTAGVVGAVAAFKLQTTGTT